LQRAEMADPAITAANLGDLGADSIHGMFHPPRLAVATPSVARRVSDGLRGGRYLARIDELLPHPEKP
jgi:pyruvate dehydrogenase E2 component (dihydrolipoamide acetyltransferase)